MKHDSKCFRKCLKAVSLVGMSAYGIYWFIHEFMDGADTDRMLSSDISKIAEKTNTGILEVNRILSALVDSGALYLDDGDYKSHWFDIAYKKKKKNSKVRREAAMSRWKGKSENKKADSSDDLDDLDDFDMDDLDDIEFDDAPIAKKPHYKKIDWIKDDALWEERKSYYLDHPSGQYKMWRGFDEELNRERVKYLNGLPNRKSAVKDHRAAFGNWLIHALEFQPKLLENARQNRNASRQKEQGETYW